MSRVTIEEAAELSFDPWDRRPEEWNPPSNRQYIDDINPNLIIVRAAWEMLFRTKKQLVDSCDELGPAAFMNLGDRMSDAIAYYKVMVTVLETAQLRHLCVAATRVEQGSWD